MIKLKFLPTENIFVLPDETAIDLLSQFPSDYSIIDDKKNKSLKQNKPLKNSTKLNSKNKIANSISSSILHLIIDI